MIKVQLIAGIAQC